MRLLHRVAAVSVTWGLSLGVALSAPVKHHEQVAAEHPDLDGVGDTGQVPPRIATGLPDTVWIADWTFDGAGGVCDDTGWTTIDNRVLKRDARVFWRVDSNFGGEGGIDGNAAILGNHDLGCQNVDGYDNRWYQAIRIPYSGSGFLSFDYLLDSEAGYDFMRVELDSACASFYRTDEDQDGVLDDPWLGARGGPAGSVTGDVSYASLFRTVEFEDSGLRLAGRVESLPITGFGVDATHCVYIAFFSDLGWSPCDGVIGTTTGAALVVDNIQINGVETPTTEDFEGALDPRISLENLWDEVGFGSWARLYPHVTDNDTCEENTTCAWLFTDDTTPTVANHADEAYGPGAFVVRNWLDNIIVSPWVNLAGPASEMRTILTFREFGGNIFRQGRIVRGWNVRTKKMVDNVDTPTPGDSVEVVRGWTTYRWNSLGVSWRTAPPVPTDRDVSVRVDPDAQQIQVLIRASDWQWVQGAGPPSPEAPGPGPYIDRVRIGRLAQSGPSIDLFPLIGSPNTNQAQDAFPTEIDPLVTQAGEHYRPTTDRFGTAAFSGGTDLGRQTLSPNLIPGDSITVWVQDVGGTGGINRVEFHAAIVAGPHRGKSPPPWTVAPNGFFVVPADTARFANGQVREDFWSVDLDDDYFRGGDVLNYFWFAEDASGALASGPPGLSSLPGSVAEAEEETNGLLEVSFLPTIDWDPGYLARIAADPHGKLEPTPQEIANSSQATCILYVTRATARRSGDHNRTSFMYTLDRLGYRGHYDVYDRIGFWPGTNNELGGRATVEQATGYAAIIHEVPTGVTSNEFPDGTNRLSGKVDQTGWYRDWLARAASNEAGTATLWILGADVVEQRFDDPLFSVDMGVTSQSPDVLSQFGINPDVGGEASFTFANGTTVDFSSDRFTVQAGCPDFQPFDGIGATGSAAVTHRWQGDTLIGDGAVVMNANTSQSWNTIMMSPTWREIRDDDAGPSSPSAEEELMAKIFTGILPTDCLQGPNPTDVGGDRDGLDALPRVTALHQNAPNPFNPVTTIRFDLARDTHVDLRIYNVTGRLVRTLVNGALKRERHQLVWDGRDDAGVSVASGIYFYRLVSADFEDTRKMVVVR